jgi:hypothetical protein
MQQADSSCTNTGSSYIVNTSVKFDRASRYQQYFCSDFYLGAGQVGVVTLKRTSGSIDPDVLITPYFDSDVMHGETSGNELVLFGDISQSGWYNIVVGDYSGSGGTVQYSVHRIDLGSVLVESGVQVFVSTLLEEMFCQALTGESCSSGSSDSAMIERGVGIALSAMQGRDLVETGRAALISEVGIAAREAGLPRPIASFLTTFASNFLDEVYSYY